MTLTPQEIEAVFALNDPNHDAWWPLYKFSRASPLAYVESLFSYPFAPDLKALLLEMAHGMPAEMWYRHAP